MNKLFHNNVKTSDNIPNSLKEVQLCRCSCRTSPESAGVVLESSVFRTLILRSVGLDLLSGSPGTFTFNNSIDSSCHPSQGRDMATHLGSRFQSQPT